MIQSNGSRQTNQPIQNTFRRTGPLDAYIYQKRSDNENMEESNPIIMVHLPRDEVIVSKDKCLHIFTDGACTKNGRKGANAAWGVLVVSDIGHIILDRFSGAVPIQEPQTNQRAELRALLKGLETAEKQLQTNSVTKVYIWSDSEYSIKCASVWGPTWKRNGWKKQNGDIQHLDLIQPLVLGTQRLGPAIEYKWLKGHKGGDSQYMFPWMFNHQVDALATEALR